MELNFTEIDDLDKQSYGNVDVNNNKSAGFNQPKYWEKTKKNNDMPKKKKVSFDDILSNMNLIVNKNGVLQSMVPKQPQYYPEQYDEPQYQQQQQPYQYQQQQYQQQQYQQQQYQQQPYQQQPYQQQPNNDPLDPAVKHSYIFNKYFKDYKDANDDFKPQVKVPKSIEEYKQMVLEERVRQIQERNRIAQIKSKKMLFTSHPNIQQNRNQGVITASKNSLRSMKFG